MDNQIINENWFEKMCNHSLDNFPSIRKPVVKKIPVECWSEIKDYDTNLNWCMNNYPEIHRYGNQVYLVTKQETK